MNTKKGKKISDFTITIAPNDGYSMSIGDKKLINTHAQLFHSKRSTNDIIKNEMLSVLFQFEEYLDSETLNSDQVYSIEYFVNQFIKVLKWNKTQFANHIDIDVSNLNKYLKGKRALNTELALKFSHCFHTPVDIWLKVQLKNDLIFLNEGEERSEKYEKYDYKNLVEMD